jgi:hypothetical protein
MLDELFSAMGFVGASNSLIRDGYTQGLLPRHCVEFPPGVEAPAKCRGFAAELSRPTPSVFLFSFI